jgi:transcriptional regulator with XRE-family HTH domain
MGIRINHERLKRELVIRGLSQADLARKAVLSNPTITSATHGRSVSPYTVGQIAKVLAETPPIDGIADLIGDHAA